MDKIHHLMIRIGGCLICLTTGVLKDFPYLKLKKECVPEFQVVKGEWKFNEGDNQNWKNPDLNDNSWQTVELPSTWEEHSNYTPDNVYGWYRRELTYLLI